MLSALLLSAFIGLSLGVLGSGGSIVTLPVLIYVARVPAGDAVGMSMAIVGATSLFGAVLHLRRGNVALPVAAIFAAAGMVGAYVGSAGTHLVSKRVLLLLFSGLLVTVGTLMLRGGGQREERGSFSVPRGLAVGFVVGLLTGFLGVGGGFLIVPALVLTAGLNTRVASGTSLAVIALNSAAGLAGQLRYAHFDWRLLGGFLLCASAGLALGIASAGRVDEKLLRRFFAMSVISLGVVLAAVNL